MRDPGVSLRRRGLVALCALLATCSDDAPTETSVGVNAVLVRVPADSVFFGAAVRAIAVASGDSATVEHPPFAWTSSDTSIAVVDDFGNVLGVGIGSVTIAAEFAGRRDEFTLRVVARRADGGVQFAEGSGYYGSSASCAITATTGLLYCRPRPDATDSFPAYRAMPSPPPVPLTQAYTSQDAQCAMGADQKIYCWGVSNHFVFGGRFSGPQEGITVRTDIVFSAMALGGHSTMCAIRADDSVLYCWGHNDLNQTGREPTISSDSMVAPVTGNLQVRAVSPSNFRTCALDLTGAPYCWGGNGSGGRGLGVSTQTGRVSTPQRVFGNHAFVSISVAEIHQCALTDAGEAYCWGQNGSGQLGDGTLEDPAELGPRPVAGGLRFSSIAALGFPNATCGITTDGDLYCWGDFAPASVSARLGERRALPYHVARGIKFSAMSPLFGRMCAVTVDGAIPCW